MFVDEARQNNAQVHITGHESDTESVTESLSGSTSNVTPKENSQAPAINEEEILINLEEYSDSCATAGILSVNGYRYKKEYPKAFKKCVDFFNKKSQQSSDMDTIMGLFLYSPRLLVDFLDSEGIFLNILGSENSWRYSINAEFYSKDHITRVYAELAGIEEAFKTLENK